MALGEKLMADDGQWLMGRVMPRELLQGIGKYLHRVTPKREDELIAAIKTRAEELIEANQDMAGERDAGYLSGCAGGIRDPQPRVRR
jgi:hypothetical protein